MTKEIGNRHIIPSYAEEEDNHNSNSVGTPSGKNKSLFETIKVTIEGSPTSPHLFNSESPIKSKSQNLTK